MFIPVEIVEKIRESNDIVDVISEHVTLNKRGKSYVGLCPFHREKTPSFHVNVDKQIYHCFGCGEGGNVISFIMKYRNLDFIEAAKMLAERANIVIPDSNDNIDYHKLELKQKLFNLNREAARYFYINLQNSKDGLKYFKGRGISPDIIKRFGLGFAIDSWDSLMKYLTSKGYDMDLIEQAGLIVKKDTNRYYDRFRNRVIFPVFDVRGRIIGFGGRVLDDSKPKYLNSPETLIFNKGNNLYGLNLAINNNSSRKIIIVEGYMDVIALHQYGIENAVASLGTALTRDQARLIKRYSDEVIICYDADTAGQTATLRGLDILSDAGLKVSIINIPKGKDPDEYIRAEGKEAFDDCIKNAMPLIEYKIKRKSESFDISSVEGKIGFLKSSAEVLAHIEDTVTVDAYVSKLSAQTNISSSALYAEIEKQRNSVKNGENSIDKHISGKNRYNNSSDRQKLYLENAYTKAEKSILYILYSNREYFKLVKNKLSCEDFTDSVYRKVANVIYEKLENEESIEPASIINLFETVEDMKKATNIFNMKIEGDNDNIEKIINDFINKIYQNKLLTKKQLMELKSKEFEAAGDIEQSMKLAKEILEIQRQLKML